MDESILLNQNEHYTAPGSPDSMNETEVDTSESNTNKIICYFGTNVMVMEYWRQVKNSLTGSRKLDNRFRVDVENILAQLVSIRLQHHLTMKVLNRRVEYFHEQFPRKRMNSIKCECDLPTKKKCQR